MKGKFKRLLKRALGFALTLTLAFSAAACGDGTNSGSSSNGGEKPEHLGLYLENGVLMKDSKPFYGVGVNYYCLLNSAFSNKWDVTPSLTALETLKSYDVRVIRFNIAGYNYIEWNYLTKLEDKYFETFDKIVEKAEELEIGLIPSFFWSHGSVADFFDEPTGTSFAQRDSKTTQFMLELTEKIVKRYAESPAIYGWEYANEINLGADLPEGNYTYQPLPASSKRSSRTKDDKMNTTWYKEGLKFWAETVRENDPYNRIIGNGDACQREYAWNLRQNNGWQLDTASQFKEIMAYLNEDMSAISIHTYAEGGARNWKNASKLTSRIGLYTDWDSYLTFIKDTAKAMNKTAYLGETGFGYADVTQSDVDNGFDAAARASVYELIADSALKTDFPLTLFWNYDHRPEFNPDDLTDHSTGTEWSWNERWEKGRIILEKIRSTNQAFDKKHG